MYIVKMKLPENTTIRVKTLSRNKKMLGTNEKMFVYIQINKHSAYFTNFMIKMTHVNSLQR